MGYAQERFNEATNQVDRAYWQGALDGEAAERERNMEVLLRIRDSWSSRRLGQLHGKDGHESSLAEACRFAVVALDEVAEVLEGEPNE